MKSLEYIFCNQYGSVLINGRFLSLRPPKRQALDVYIGILLLFVLDSFLMGRIPSSGSCLTNVNKWIQTRASWVGMSRVTSASTEIRFEWPSTQFFSISLQGSVSSRTGALNWGLVQNRWELDIESDYTMHFTKYGAKYVLKIYSENWIVDISQASKQTVVLNCIQGNSRKV